MTQCVTGGQCHCQPNIGCYCPYDDKVAKIQSEYEEKIRKLEQVIIDFEKYSTYDYDGSPFQRHVKRLLESL